MRGLRIHVVGLLLAVSACGGNGVLECEEDPVYLRAREMPRVKAPDGLDDLDPLRERPVPQAAPQAPQTVATGCLEQPPSAATQ